MSETTPASGAADAAATEPFRYSATLAADIESRWQDTWEKEGTFNAPNPVGPLATVTSDAGSAGAVAAKPHSFIMDMFPYPSGAGLHVGHPWATSPPTSTPATSG